MALPSNLSDRHQRLLRDPPRVGSLWQPGRMSAEVQRRFFAYEEALGRERQCEEQHQCQQEGK